MPRIRLHLPGGSCPDRSYDILVRPGVIGEIGPTLAGRGVRRTVVLVDAAVEATHGSSVLESLRGKNIDAFTIAVPSGEGSKTVDEAARIWESMAHRAVDRQTHVVAVGGGVVGDLAGFVAASFARGLPVWQVPTTLMAQVDSSIGGKTGVNLAAGKNLVGAFWQPLGVFTDIDTLVTLPDREFRSGLAEVVKYGMILDGEFFSWLEGHAESILARNAGALTTVVERSAAIKADVVEKDEREQNGLRAALNYGHTFAHAFETASGYGAMLHGEAVSIGMHCAARLAESLGRIGSEVVDRQRRLLESLRLPIAAPKSGSSPDSLIAIMLRDKKSVAGTLRFVLPSRIGSVDLVDGIEAAAVRHVLD